MKGPARGLSLLELVVAVSLMALVILSLLELLPSSVLSLHRSQDIEVATAYGVRVLDGARLHPPSSPGETAEDVLLDGTRFHVVRRIQAVPGSKLMDVLVTVSAPRGNPVVLGTRISPDVQP